MRCTWITFLLSISAKIIRTYKASVSNCGENCTIINHRIIVAEFNGISVVYNLWLVIYRKAAEYKVSFNYGAQNEACNGV